jgi:predicted nucleotidyltransferase
LSEEFWLREARRRREVFENLDTYLRRLAAFVKRLDPASEIYLFGSVAEGRYLYSSDIDVLVVSDVLKPGETLAALWAEGFGDPFEIHVVDRAAAEVYRRRARLIPITSKQ